MARARPKPLGVRSAPDRSRRRGRMAALTLGMGLPWSSFALVFSIAFGTRGVARHATALHHADEALRSATVVRSQVGLATHLTLLERDFDVDASDAIDLSAQETRLGLDDLALSLTGMSEATGAADAPMESAAATFRSTAQSILTALENGDLTQAQTLTREDLDQDFRTLLQCRRCGARSEAGEVAAASALMGRAGDVARFLVAFLVPTSAILLTENSRGASSGSGDLEVRLDTEKELGRARDEFVANASHELRTPLTSIFGLAHLVEEDEVASSPSPRRWWG